MISKGTNPANAMPNWIHLDLKGVIPSAPDMLHWVDWLAEAGFNGIVFEYEDRVDWTSWPGTFRAGYSAEEWRAIWKRCAERKLEVVPLVQTMGHLEWLLGRERYASFREGGLVDELCPSHPEVRERLIGWIDEVIALHPGLRYLHLGGDEVWQLASCGFCRERAAGMPEGRAGVYLAHMVPLLEHTLARGVTPLIWADMFWPEDRQPLAARLPEGVVLLDWQYGWLGATQVNPGLVRSGRPVWAADAVRCAYDETQVLSPLRQRAQNIDIWHRQLAEEAIPGVIHTCWSRSSSFRPLYGPFEAWLPLFGYAANAERGAAQPLFKRIDRMDAALYSRGLLAQEEDVEPLRDALRAIASESTGFLERRCCAWWELALDYAALRNATFGTLAGRHALRTAEFYRGRDGHVRAQQTAGRAGTARNLVVWQEKATALWREWNLSDGEEFFESRSGVLMNLLTL